MRIPSLSMPQVILRLLKRSEVVKVLPTKPVAGVAPRSFGRCFFYSLLLLLLGLAAGKDLRADSISGTIKDPSGAVVVGARIEITGGNLTQAIVLASDESGKFTAPDLSAGKYIVRVNKEGFEEVVTTVDLHGTADLPLKLTIAEQQVQINVTEKSLAFANSDAFYRQLRGIGLGATFPCENFSLPWMWEHSY